NPYCVINGGHENFTVSDFPGPGGVCQNVDDLADPRVGCDDLQLDFRNQVDCVFGAAINFRVPLLPSMATNLANGTPVPSDARQRGFNVVQLVRLNDGFDFFHNVPIY